MKKPVGYRLTEEAIRILKELANGKGVSQAAILEMLLRDEARRVGVK